MSPNNIIKTNKRIDQFFKTEAASSALTTQKFAEDNDIKVIEFTSNINNFIFQSFVNGSFQKKKRSRIKLKVTQSFKAWIKITYIYTILLSTTLQ